MTGLYGSIHDIVKGSHGNRELLLVDLDDLGKNVDEKSSLIIKDLILAIKNFTLSRGAIIEVIRCLMMIVETIPGRGLGSMKKEKAFELFSEILGLLGVSQRDRKVYLSLFDGVVEMAFWGKEWLKNGGWDMMKLFCCK